METENINWYPGHMNKTRELIRQNLKLVDLVIEVTDARIPVSSRNPLIDEIVGAKRRIVALNKSDLADPQASREWLDRLSGGAVSAVLLDSLHGRGVRELIAMLKKAQDELRASRAPGRALRFMIVGVPNSGKSSLINRLSGRKSARTGDRPGVTRGKQWITLKSGMQMLDTPGILWPKLEDPLTGLHLAFCGSIKDEILDRETLALRLVEELSEKAPRLLRERYGLDELSGDPLHDMEAIAAKRGFLLPGKRTDYARTAATLLDEFRGGRIGRITIEKAGEEF